MSITSFVEQSRFPLKVREDGSEYGERIFEILSSDDTTTMADIRAHASCPAKGSGHPDNAAALVRTLEAEPVEGFHNLHLLTCNYDTKTETQDDEDDPEAALVKAGFETFKVQKPAFFDGFGRPNVNTAGDLIPGLVRNVTNYRIPIEFKSTTIPLYLFGLANTLNVQPLSFYGITFPAGTLTMEDVSKPKEIDSANDGTKYWTITANIVHDPDGFYALHPNTGKHELIYQTRTGASAAWTDDTYTNYDAKSPTTDRRIIKRRILTDEDQATANDIWLDSLGRAVRTPTITTTASANTGSIQYGSKTLTMSGATFTTGDEGETGASIAIVGAGPHGRTLTTRIASISSTTVAVLDDAAGKTVTGKAVYFPGVICLRVINQPFADWSGVPLPNNDPS